MENKENIVSKLTEIFGSDAISKDNTDVGLCLDLSQKEIINKSWRTDNPSKLTAYKDSYKTLFPVNRDSKDFLNVPSLDDSV